MATSDRGPVTPLYLNREEALVLAEAVSLFMRLSSHMVDESTQTLATEILRWKEGDASVARMDQVLARARERLPLLTSLQTALLELGDTLDREAGHGD
jgi:hypothetical protein